MNTARKLTLSDAVSWDRKEMWLQVREKLAVFPVRYSHEHIPYLVFESTINDDFFMLKPGLIGKTWVIWSEKPAANQRRKAFTEEGA